MAKNIVVNQRGQADTSAKPRFLVVGRVLKPHGTGGEVRVEVISDTPERFSWLDKICVGDEARSIAIEQVRYHKSFVLLKLEGYDDRASAEQLRSETLQVPIEQAIPLRKGEYYLFQTIGLSVSNEAGDYLGDVIDVIETGANNVFVIEGARGELLIPDTEEVVRLIDFDQGTMVISIIPGLIA